MSCPHVTGTAALMLSIKPTLTAAQVKNNFLNTVRTDSYTSSAWNATWGYGKMDVYKACSLAVNTPMVTFINKNINIGTVRLGQSKDTVLTLTNTGVGTVTVNNINSSSTAFSARPTSYSITTGSSVKDTLRFSPSKYGADSAKIIITSNALSSPDTIVMSGTSPIPALTILKTVNAFGTVNKNTTKKDTLKIINTSINILTVDSVYTKTNAFVVDRTSGTVGTDTLKIVVSFTPVSYSTYADTVYLRNNSSTSLVKIPLSGICAIPIPLATVDSLKFINCAKGDSVSMTTYLKNKNVSPMLISTVATGTGIFTASCASTSIAGNDSAALAVQFKPVHTVIQ